MVHPEDNQAFLRFSDEFTKKKKCEKTMIEHETMASLGLGEISMAQWKGQYLKNDVRRFERCAYANHDMLKSISAFPRNRD